jgi:hypothetical protein
VRSSAYPGRSAVRAAALLGILCGSIPAVRAQEPLYLRIRANPDARLDGTAAAGPAGAPLAAGAARRESAWERSDRRARIAIASVCTGCLAGRSVLQAFMPSSVAEAPASDMPSPLSSPSPLPFAPTAGDP